MDETKGLNNVLSLLQRFDKRFDVIEQTLGCLQGEITNIKSQVESMKSSVVGIELSIENETNKHIHILAEGHTGLVHKIDEMSAKLDRVGEKADVLDMICKTNTQRINELKLAE